MATSDKIKKTTVKRTISNKPQKIGRPINCFMAFRLEKHQEISSQSPGLNHRDISKIIAKWWKEASEAEKAPYRAIASKAKAEHAKLYPDYKYQPVKKSERKVRSYHRKEDPATRKRKSQAKEELMKQWMGGPTSPASSFCDSPLTPKDETFPTPSLPYFKNPIYEVSYLCGSSSPSDVQDPMTTDPLFLSDLDDDTSSFCGSTSIQVKQDPVTTDASFFSYPKDNTLSFCDSPSIQDDPYYFLDLSDDELSNCDSLLIHDEATVSSSQSSAEHLCEPMYDLMPHELKQSPLPPSFVLSLYSTLDQYHADNCLPECINPQMLSLYPDL